MRVFAGIIAMLLVVIAPARADVTICNKWPQSNLSFAVAAEVTDPYETWHVAGWFNIDAQTCKVVFTGDYTGQKIYYFVYVDGDREARVIMSGVHDSYTFCVPADTSAFDQKGSVTSLQPPCRNALRPENFFCVAIGGKDFTYSLFWANDPSLSPTQRQELEPTRDPCA